MRLNVFGEGTNAEEESLGYPEFYFKAAEGHIKVTEVGADQILLPPSIKEMRQFEFLMEETFSGIHNCYADIEWLPSRDLLTL